MRFSITRILGLLLLTAVLASSCRSEFETVRTSNDPQLMYKKALQYYDDEEWFKSQTLLELAIPYYRGRPESEDLFYKYAYTYYNMRQYILAQHWLTNFVNTYPNSPLREDADWKIANCSLKQSPTFRLDQSESDKAIELFQTFANSYPKSEKVADCNRIIDELRLKKETKSFEEGKLYYSLGQYQSAMRSLENTLITYPETRNREEIKYLIVKSAFELAEKSIYAKKKERFEVALEKANEFLNKYQNSERLDEVKGVVDSSNKRIKSLTNG